MESTITALLLTLIAGSATGIGGALVLFKKKLSPNTLAGALGLSAGVMIFISLAEMFPEAQAEPFMERLTEMTAGTVEGMETGKEYRAFPVQAEK